MEATTAVRVGRLLLAIGGCANIMVAILHVFMKFIGISAFNYFGAPVALIQLIENNHTWLVMEIMGLLVGLFLVAGFYGLSGAKIIRRLPGLNFILVTIGVIYTVRGAVVVLIPFPGVVGYLIHNYPTILGMGRPIMLHDWVFSFISLLVGLIYLVGWRLIKRY